MDISQTRQSTVRAIFNLARAGNFPSVASNVIAAFILSNGLGPLSWTLALAVVGGLLAYAGGSTFNDVFDADFDAKHRPERAIPQGVVPRGSAIAIGAAELAAGLGLFVWAGASLAMAAGLLATILAYDWLHKRWSGSVLLMAGCRLLLGFTVATLTGHTFEPVFLGWAAAVYIYIVVLSVLARMEYGVQRADDSLPAVGLAKAGGYKARGNRIGRLLAFIPLIDAVALLVVAAWPAALACVLAIPLGGWAQRKAAAT